MKKNLFITFILLIGISQVTMAFDSPADYTGEAFFTPPSLEDSYRSSLGQTKAPYDESDSHTIPPIKQLRLKWEARERAKMQEQYELAPTAQDLYTGEIGTSEYASQEVKEDFDSINPDGFESDEFIETNKKSKKRFFKKKNRKTEISNHENIILDCQKVDYDADNYAIYATGNVSVEFVKQKTTVKANIITFDRLRNTLKAEGNVRILKGDKTVTGDYIFVDLNEENAIIENPLMQTANIEIRSQKGSIQGNTIVQENGIIEVKDSFPINFRSGKRGPQMGKMLMPQNHTLTEDMSSGLITFTAKEIKVNQQGDHEVISLKKPRLYRGDKLVFKTPSVKVYTNKNHDYAETDHWEIGSIRGLGLYAGPGFVAKLPKGSVFKLMPMLNYKSGFGVGAVGRFSSGTNHTMLAYGTAMEKFLAYGKQELDDNLYLHYGTNSYMEEWFMGRRRPKYGISLVYQKGYSARNFLLKDKMSSFTHRFEGGYFHDLDFDGRHEKISGNDIGTSRFKYMAQATQNIYQYINEEDLKAFRFDIVTQLSSALYGTGDTQIIGRIAPNFHMQYKRWMQDIGYYFSVYDDSSPLERFDAYRYGQQSMYLREYFRICRWLTICWFGNVNLSNDSPNGKLLQENAFYFAFGPDDLKFNLGYDFVRETLRATFEIMMDAKGTRVEYDRFEITQDNKSKKTKKETSSSKRINPNLAPIATPILDQAVVENIKDYENVL
ncbi:LPS-assembly protein LptD [bacterium]|nr:LPS-assembly protein LptD [bacterium]